MKTTLLFSSFFICVFLYGQKTILWKISSTKTQTVSYLLGTNHLFGDSFVDSFPIIKEKILASNLVITETKMDREAIAAAYNKRISSDSINLILSKQDIDYINDIIRKNNTVPLSKYYPGELVLKLQANYPKFGCRVFNVPDKMSMDEYIQYIGKNNGKQLYTFETDSFQMQMITTSFGKYNWDYAKRNIPIILALYRNQKGNEQLCTSVNKYAVIDVDYKFTDSCNYLKGSAMSNDEFIKKRNEAWIVQLSQILPTNNCFIAVGFGHLCNQCGLVKQIEALGYTMEPITMK